jgi:predicted membrane protein
VAFTDVSQLAAGGHQEIGELKVDLRNLTATTDASYAAHVDMGSLEVEAPENVNVFINYRVDSGALIVDGKQQQAGSDLSGLVRPTTFDPRRHTLTLNLSVDQGVVQVQR